MGCIADQGRIILSDSKYFIQCMLATQLNEYVNSKQIDKNSLIKLNEFVVNAVQGRRSVHSLSPSSSAELTDRLLIILKLEVVPYSGDKIGNPANLEQALQAEKAPAPAAAPVSAAAPAGASRNGAAPPAKGGRPANRSATGKDMGALYPIEGLSPYQNKSVSLSVCHCYHVDAILGGQSKLELQIDPRSNIGPTNEVMESCSV